jgi:hypothetical protein
MRAAADEDAEAVGYELRAMLGSAEADVARVAKRPAIVYFILLCEACFVLCCFVSFRFKVVVVVVYCNSDRQSISNGVSKAEKARKSIKETGTSPIFLRIEKKKKKFKSNNV